jgi:hypothetical protein
VQDTAGPHDIVHFGQEIGSIFRVIPDNKSHKWKRIELHTARTHCKGRLRMQNRIFKMPKQHSMSFRTDSIWQLQIVCATDAVCLRPHIISYL